MHATNVIEDTLLVGKCYPNPDGSRWVFIGYFENTKVPMWQSEKSYLEGHKSLFPMRLYSAFSNSETEISSTPST